MKKLICAKEIEALDKQGQKVMYIDEDTLVTPSAKDEAAKLGIEIKVGTAPVEPAAPAVCETPAKCCEGSAVCETPAACCQKSAPQGSSIDSEVIYNALKALMDKGMLGNLMATLGQDVPYVSESDANLKVVRGNTAKWEVLDTGNPADEGKVFYNELINAEDGSDMGAGFITIENTSFPWETLCQELYYVIEGTLTIESEGKVYTGHPGDCFFFKKGANLKFGSPDKVKAYYATH